MELMQRKLRYSRDSYFKLYHLCYYLSNSAFKNEDVQRIISFKERDVYTVRHFASLAIQYLLDQRMEQDLIIVRALHSNELKALANRNDPLDRIGKSLAATFNCFYKPELLRKTRVTKAVKLLNTQERKAELKQTYLVSKTKMDLNNRKILIIDDVVTTGVTICSIIKAVLDEFPLAKINVFSLAWTPTQNQQSYIQQQGNKPLVFNEPELNYGNSSNKDWLDADFESGVTRISVL
ncbi:MAG: ComF family protein [Flavobacterium sp.]|nr:MAG: ComF family protein [Flavobacterium sp.]